MSNACLLKSRRFVFYKINKLSAWRRKEAERPKIEIPRQNNHLYGNTRRRKIMWRNMWTQALEFKNGRNNWKNGSLAKRKNHQQYKICWSQHLTPKSSFNHYRKMSIFSKIQFWTMFCKNWIVFLKIRNRKIKNWKKISRVYKIRSKTRRNWCKRSKIWRPKMKHKSRNCRNSEAMCPGQTMILNLLSHKKDCPRSAVKIRAPAISKNWQIQEMKSFRHREI